MDIKHTKAEVEELTIFWERAFSLLKLGNYKEAIQVFNKILEIDPRGTNALQAITEIYLINLGDGQKAIEAINEFINTNPGNVPAAKAHNLKGIVLERMGDFQEAIKAYDEGLNMDSEDVVVLTNKAGLLLEMKDYMKALEISTEAFRLDKNNKEAFRIMSTALSHLTGNKGR
jgi:tetratricopeptide (TPR) repeat protein